MSGPRTPLRVQYDPEADAAYIFFVPTIKAGGVAKTVLIDFGNEPFTVNLDVDEGGHLLGLEVLDATKRLHPDLLRQTLQ
jgi:uncharacterized protein YuzE